MPKYYELDCTQDKNKEKCTLLFSQTSLITIKIMAFYQTIIPYLGCFRLFFWFRIFSPHHSVYSLLIPIFSVFKVSIRFICAIRTFFRGLNLIFVKKCRPGDFWKIFFRIKSFSTLWSVSIKSHFKNHQHNKKFRQKTKNWAFGYCICKNDYGQQLYIYLNEKNATPREDKD